MTTGLLQKANDDRLPAVLRSEEYAADAHGVVLLRRAGYAKEMMIDTLTWLPAQREPTAVNTGITAIVRKMAAANSLWLPLECTASS